MVLKCCECARKELGTWAGEEATTQEVTKVCMCCRALVLSMLLSPSVSSTTTLSSPRSYHVELIYHMINAHAQVITIMYKKFKT